MMSGVVGGGVRSSRWPGALVACAVLVGAAPAPAHKPARHIAIRVLSNRADLVSGGDALVELTLPTAKGQLQVSVAGRDARPAFRGIGARRYTGLIRGLRVGRNTLVARLGRRRARLAITNHPIGGPIFAGPQVEPWFCATEAWGLGRPENAQCDAMPVVSYVYKSSSTGRF